MTQRGPAEEAAPEQAWEPKCPCKSAINDPPFCLYDFVETNFSLIKEWIKNKKERIFSSLEYAFYIYYFYDFTLWL
jgi:hypothetical protein